MSYEQFFRKAMRSSHETEGFSPYPYQGRMAACNQWPTLLNVPTGVGKTAAVVLAWLYRRHAADTDVRQQTPRRLVYCLPMRTLVEQTQSNVNQWLTNLDLADGDDRVDVHVLMGGEEADDWDLHPDRDAILIGTQDMLISRALNRGYGMSRYRWPVHFALLNNDCQWVLDETQLMGVGSTTAAQLDGFRQSLSTYGPAHTLWMSATLDTGAVETVDNPKLDGGWTAEALGDDDFAHEDVDRLIKASKPCGKAATELSPNSAKKGYEAALADEILSAHRPGTLSLVVVNQVMRAQKLTQSLQKALKKNEDAPEVDLIHSRYRPHERRPQQERALDEDHLPDAGRIIVATQAIEAGVDLSAATLFTELAPWSSLVQRFGRCNRRGVCGHDGVPEAQVRWVDIDTVDVKKARPLALPYQVEELDQAREIVSSLDDVGPAVLANQHAEQPDSVVHVIRRKDLLDLFDTTPDLSGNDLDVSRYIREADDTSVQVYWRDWDISPSTRQFQPPAPNDDDAAVEFPAPDRDELCGVAVGQFRDFAKKLRKQEKTRHLLWRWEPLERQWNEVEPEQIRPGTVLLLHATAGGYDCDLGWTGDPKHRPVCDCRKDLHVANEAMDDDDTGSGPIELAVHLRDVADEAESLQKTLQAEFSDDLPWAAVVRAARWHDVGKAHPAFQAAMGDCEQVTAKDPDGTKLWAKSGRKGYPGYRIPQGEDAAPQFRKGFRHELASALAWLARHEGEDCADLVAYLVAAHHGKVRMSIRSMPNESRPPEPSRLFARGIWSGDRMPLVDADASAGEVAGEVALDLELMKLGDSDDGRPSWLSRTLDLRERFGPFRLAFLETLVRVADWRGSKGETEK
ncbi:CRISPR-associated endonuclease/helicase Cas3 [Maioricimonas rarisocia]|uniref:CRISPR-associated endonuclease/helicase Cas3 n=1 Tax=Maioricimonas rarisocia TaxID=2528026 RepID=A0A517ZAW9_9PLAN|nr:CRISPR-associated endonuclease Cas3'' [Maioricimonas rarisocia]QDU39642.1 CRISPR-associated endonuclease/helicase Cas3 [Maioricimonas rarisocia]